jgi:hypothetical protein
VIGIRHTARSSRPHNASPRRGGSKAAAIAAVLFATVAQSLSLAGAGPAQAGLDGPLATVLNLPGSGELNVLTSVLDHGRTFPAHTGVPIAC